MTVMIPVDHDSDTGTTARCLPLEFRPNPGKNRNPVSVGLEKSAGGIHGLPPGRGGRIAVRTGVVAGLDLALSSLMLLDAILEAMLVARWARANCLPRVCAGHTANATLDNLSVLGWLYLLDLSLLFLLPSIAGPTGSSA